MARRVEKSTRVQAPGPRASSGAGCEGWVAGRLDEQRCLRTRLLRTHVPKAWAKAQRARQGHWARHTRRVIVRKALTFLSLALPGQSSPGSPYLCGRPSVRLLHACSCATVMCTMQGLDFTDRKLGRRTYPLCDITG